MKADGGAPADTRTMGIVHSALRRDLERTRVALTTAPYPEGIPTVTCPTSPRRATVSLRAR